MPQELPRPFENVIIRDQWVWQKNAFDLPLLEEKDQDRLLDLPGNSTSDSNLFSSEWATYARMMAQVLEKKQRWLEAQAYWFAYAQHSSQNKNQSPEERFEAFTGIVKTGGCAAGMSLTSLGFEEIVENGLQSLSVHVQRAIICSLLMIGTLHSSVFEDLKLSNTARIALSEMLSHLHEQRIKGSHHLFEESVRTYSQLIDQLKATSDILIVNTTLETLKGIRGKLLEKINKLQNFVLDQDKALLLSLQVLLGTDLTIYIKAQEDQIGEAYETWKLRYLSIIEKTHTVESHLSNCIVLPLILAIERTIHSHLLSTAHARLPDLQLQLLKPKARWQEGIFAIDIKLENHGVDIARECQFSLHVPNPRIQEKKVLPFGILEPGQSRIETCNVSVSENADSLSMVGILEWRDRLGGHQRSESIKIERQREIDWEVLSDLAPYPVRSIRDPEKLKGRNDQLRELRLGFNSSSSFMITGQKRVGKTSLVNVLLQSFIDRRNVLSLYIPIGELSAAAGDDLGRIGHELIRRVLEEYEDKFREKADIDIPSLEEFRESFNDSLARCLRQFAKKHSEIRLVFALDDFDELPTTLFTGSVGRTLFLSLRSMINTGLSFFFIGSERLPTIMREQAERLNQVKTLKVDYLNREALVALVKEPVQEKLVYTDEAITEIDTWSARNPYFATLICSAIWQRTIEKRDYWITEHDVIDAIMEFVKRSSRNSYEHFWSDSPLASDEARRAYESRSTYILLALSKRQPHSLAFANRHDVIASCTMLDKEDASLHLQDLINYNVIEAHAQNSDLIRIRVPLFTLWLIHGGATELERDELMKQKLRAGLTKREELTASEVVAVADGLSYRGRKISTDEVRVWASQFGHLDEQRLMLKLLHRLRDQGLYTEEKLMHALSQLHGMIRLKARERNFDIQLSHASRQVQNVYVTHADGVGESGSALVRSYRSSNKIPERLCGTPEKVFSAIGKNTSSRAIVVCVDDFIGSGHSAAAQINNLLPRLGRYVPNWHDRVLLIYATIVGFEQGIQFIEAHVQSGIVVLSLKILTEADKAFSSNNTIFETAEERQRAYNIAHKIGLVLQRENPLGWEDSQALVVFPDNVPNNTLPVFFRDNVEYNGRKWRALFPRS